MSFTKVGGGDGWGRGEQWGEMETTVLEQQLKKDYIQGMFYTNIRNLERFKD